MKHVVIYCALSLVLFLSPPCVLSAEMIDKIIAIFDQDLLLLSEIREQTAKPITLIIANIQTSAQPEQDAIPYLLERRLLEREIRYLAYPKERELIKNLALSYLAMTYQHGTADELINKLEQAGISTASLDDELLLYMKGMDYIRRKYRFNADIESPQVVMELFQAWIKELRANVKFQMIP